MSRYSSPLLYRHQRVLLSAASRLFPDLLIPSGLDTSIVVPTLIGIPPRTWKAHITNAMTKELTRKQCRYLCVPLFRVNIVDTCSEVISWMRFMLKLQLENYAQLELHYDTTWSENRVLLLS